MQGSRKEEGTGKKKTEVTEESLKVKGNLGRLPESEAEPMGTATSLTSEYRHWAARARRHVRKLLSMATRVAIYRTNFTLSTHEQTQGPIN